MRATFHAAEGTAGLEIAAAKAPSSGLPEGYLAPKLQDSRDRSACLNKLVNEFQ